MLKVPHSPYSDNLGRGDQVLRATPPSCSFLVSTSDSTRHKSNACHLQDPPPLTTQVVSVDVRQPIPRIVLEHRGDPITRRAAS